MKRLEAAGRGWLQFHPECSASQFELSLAPGTHRPAGQGQDSAAIASRELLGQAPGETLRGSLCDSQSAEVRRVEG